MNQQDITNFSNAIESMRKYQRYELIDRNNTDLLDQVYVDPISGNGILNTCLRDNTTVLVGRKGTGKSTILMHLQNIIRKEHNNIMTCYIDVKEVYSQAKRTYESFTVSSSGRGTQHEEYSLQRKFILDFLEDLISEIKKNYESFWSSFCQPIKTRHYKSAVKKLEEIQDKIKNNKSLTSIELQSLQNFESEGAHLSSSSATASLGLDKVTLGASGSTSSEMRNTYTRLFAKVFEIDTIIAEIKGILQVLEFKKLFIILDDFSEVEQEALQQFCNVIITPLDNSSNNFIKLKICAYPGRLELGTLDPQKIDIRYIDYFQLYLTSNRLDMEKNAIDFTKRILEQRIKIFTNKSFSDFFDVEKTTENEYHTLLFQMTLNVIRHLGLILNFAFEESVRTKSKITKIHIIEACKKFYLERIKSYFTDTNYMQIAYNERLEIFQLQSLLELIIEKQKINKKNISSGHYTAQIYNSSRNNPFTSHFNVPNKYEKILQTLEHNFFIHKYNSMVNKKGTEVSIFALNYGLCLEENLRWGKPQENSSQRTYFIEHPFDFSELVVGYMASARRIICRNCGALYQEDMLQTLQKFSMNCFACSTPKSVTIIESLDENDKCLLQNLEKTVLLEPDQYRLMKTIFQSQQHICSVQSLSAEIDISKQKIGWVAKKLREDYNYIDRVQTSTGVLYKLTPEGTNFLTNNIS